MHKKLPKRAENKHTQWNSKVTLTDLKYNSNLSAGPR